MALYSRIRDLREDSDKTQAEIAEYLGITAQYYGKYEKGEREIPFSRAVQLADYYNISLDYLSGRTNNLHGESNPDLTEDQIKLAELYSKLTEKNRGKLELFAEQLLEKQSRKTAKNTKSS